MASDQRKAADGKANDGKAGESGAIDRLIARARSFRAGPYIGQQPLYRELIAQGQSPAVLMIACSDSRVDPTIIFDLAPGEVFMLRHVANLVPAHAPNGGPSATAAALEFGICALGVAHVVVLGHGQCGGIDALLRGQHLVEDGGTIGPWLADADPARTHVLDKMHGADHAAMARALEFESIRHSLRNLGTYPWIAERIANGTLSLHGWHFEIGDGVLTAVDPDGGETRLCE